MSRTLIRSTAFAFLAGVSLIATAASAATDPAAVVKHYAELGHAKYEDALITAKAFADYRHIPVMAGWQGGWYTNLLCRRHASRSGRR